MHSLKDEIRIQRFPRHYPGGLIGPCDAPVELEVFLSTLCPHSKRAYPEIRDIVEQFHGKLMARVNLLVQPWNHQEVLLSKAVIATGLIDRNAGWKLLDAIFANQDQFTDERVFNKSAQDIYIMLASFVEKEGIDKRKFLDMVHSDEVTWRLKWSTMYARQNGLHFSPSFMLQGLHIYEAESTWSADKWKKLIQPIVDDAANYEKTRGPEHLRQAREHPGWESGHHAQHMRGYDDRERSGYEYSRGMGEREQQYGGRRDEPGFFEKLKETVMGESDKGGRGYTHGQQPVYQDQGQLGMKRDIHDRSTDRSTDRDDRGVLGKMKDLTLGSQGTQGQGQQEHHDVRDKGTTSTASVLPSDSSTKNLGQQQHTTHTQGQGQGTQEQQGSRRIHVT